MQINSAILEAKIGNTKFWKYHLEYRKTYFPNILSFISMDKDIKEKVFYDDGGKFIYSNKWFLLVDAETNPTIFVKPSFSSMPDLLLVDCGLNIVFPERLGDYTTKYVKLGKVNKLIVQCKSLTSCYRISCSELTVSKNTEDVRYVNTEQVLLNYNNNFKCTRNSFYKGCMLAKLIICQEDGYRKPPYLCVNTEIIDLHISGVYGKDLMFVDIDYNPSSIRVVCKKHKWSFTTDALLIYVWGKCFHVNERNPLNKDFV